MGACFFGRNQSLFATYENQSKQTIQFEKQIVPPVSAVTVSLAEEEGKKLEITKALSEIIPENISEISAVSAPVAPVSVLKETKEKEPLIVLKGLKR